MFGQPASTPFGSSSTTNTPFGSGGSTGFGAPAPSAFGSTTTTPTFGNTSGFGAAPAAPFGGGSAFGGGSTSTFGGGGGAFGGGTSTFQTSTQPSPFGQAPAPPGGSIFGQPAAAPTGGGLFGSTSTTTASTPFGTSSTGGFGGFGSTASTTPAFGAQPAFGSPAPAPTGGMFGAPAPSTGFGSVAAPSTSIFGAAPAPATTGLFGAPAPVAGGNLFGSPPAPAPVGFGSLSGVAGGGTKAAQYTATPKADGSGSIIFTSLAGMPQYENKQFEELRFEDYSQGTRNNPSAASAGGGFGGGFGAAPAPGGLFGQPSTQAPATGFGGGGFASKPPATGGLFGSTAPAPAFGQAPAPSGGLFGSTPAPATGGLFGSAPAPSAFGQAPAPTSGGLFGSAPAPSAFGQAPAPTGGGLFGSAPAPSAFGQASAPAGGGLFGGAAPAPSAFGQPAPAPTGGLFGSPAPAPAFGAAPAGGSLFGAAPSPGTSLFGAAPSGAFGTPAPAPGGGMFSPPAPAPGGFFGAPQAQAQQPSMSLFSGNVIPQADDAVLAQKLAAVDNQRKELEQTDVWRGRPPQGSTVTPTSRSDAALGLHVSPYSASSAGLVAYRASPRSMTNIRPRGFGTVHKSPDVRNLGRSLASPMKSPESYLGSGYKHLVIKPDAHKPRPSIRLEMTDVPQIADSERPEAREDVIRAPAKTPPLRASARPSPPQAMPSPADGITSPPADENAPPPQSARKADSSGTSRSAPVNDSSYDFYQTIISPPGGAGAKRSPGESTTHDILPKLTKLGYTVTPSIEELSKMSEADLATVTGFTITRPGYASVHWEGAVDVRGVDLDNVVCIEDGDVAVYDADEAQGTKPLQGQKLNRPAIITMQNMFPRGDKDADASVKEKYTRRLVKSTEKMGAEFLSYNSDTGVWSFRVPHFSRYRLDDESSDDEDGPMETSENQPQNSVDFGSGERGGRSQELNKGTVKKSVRFREYVEYEDTDDYAEALDTEMVDADALVMDAASAAYTILQDGGSPPPSREESSRTPEHRADSIFEDECMDYNEKPSEPLAVVGVGMQPATSASATTITLKLAQKCGVTKPTSSGTDYGLRMGRSFRVGWKPTGALFHIKAQSKGTTTNLQQSIPSFSEENGQMSVLLPLVQAHLAHATKVSAPSAEGPLFTFSGDTDIMNALQEMTMGSKQIRSTHADHEQRVVMLRALTLLSCLVKEGMLTDYHEEGEQALSDPSEAVQTLLRQWHGVDACRMWLVDACRNDVSDDVRKALSANNAHSAIFACLSGGDIEQAVTISTQHGHLELAALIAAGRDGSTSIHEQVQEWLENGSSQHIPSELMRIYTLLGGDMSVEEQKFARGESALDWRRRLCMLLSYGMSRESSLRSIMDKYDADVTKGLSPYPAPRHMATTKRTPDGTKCVLYKILELVRGSAIQQDLATIVAPFGISSSKRDFAGSFHLASAISALNCCPALSAREEASILDSYATQLSNSGNWEWAVYVMLCSFGGDFPPEIAQSRMNQAKEIVIRNYQSSTSAGARSKRAFLEDKVCVPSHWFEEALAHQCAQNGDVIGYVTHLAKVSVDEARETLEELVIPNLLFQSTEDIENSMDFLEPFVQEDETSLAAATMDFFVLTQDVMAMMEGQTREEIQQSLGGLLELADSVEDRFLSHRAQLENRAKSICGLRVYPTSRVVPQEVFLAEALAGVSFLKLQLEALNAGGSVLEKDSGTVHFKVASQLAFLRKQATSSQAETATTIDANESVLRGMI